MVSPQPQVAKGQYLLPLPAVLCVDAGCFAFSVFFIAPETAANHRFSTKFSEVHWL